MKKRKLAIGTLISSALIAVPTIVATSCGAQEQKPRFRNIYSYKGSVYKPGTHELSPRFIESLHDFKKNNEEYFISKRSFASIPGDVLDIFVRSLYGDDIKRNGPEIIYDLSSLDLDYFSPKILEYIPYGFGDVRVTIVLDNNKFKNFDFSSLPSWVTRISLNNNYLSGKLDMSFIKKIHPIDISLNNNKLTSIDYTNIQKYIKSANNSSKLTSIDINLDSKNKLSWKNESDRALSWKKFKLSVFCNKIDQNEFISGTKSINKKLFM